jgi:hypothetical protein
LKHSSLIPLDIAYLEIQIAESAAMHNSDDAPSLDSRLDNWGNADRGRYDPADALIIDEAWRRLKPRHREMLRMAYLWHADREVICRRLKIPRHQRNSFDLELAAAKLALARQLTATR